MGEDIFLDPVAWGCGGERAEEALLVRLPSKGSQGMHAAAGTPAPSQRVSYSIASCSASRSWGGWRREHGHSPVLTHSHPSGWLALGSRVWPASAQVSTLCCPCKGAGVSRTRPSGWKCCVLLEEGLSFCIDIRFGALLPALPLTLSVSLGLVFSICTMDIADTRGRRQL